MGKVKYLAIVALAVALSFVSSHAQYTPPPQDPTQAIAIGTLSSAQLLSLNTVSVSAIAAPGAGKAIVVDNYVLEMVAGTPYSGTGTLQMIYSSGTFTAGTGVSQCATTVLTSSTNAVCIGSTLVSTNVSSSDTVFVNNGVSFRMGTAQDTAGTGVINYWIKYHVVSGL